MKKKYVFQFAEGTPDVVRLMNGAEAAGDEVSFEVFGLSINMANRLKKAFGGSVRREEQ